MLVDRSLGSLVASQVVQPLLPSIFENQVRQSTAAAWSLPDPEDDIPLEDPNSASDISQNSIHQKASVVRSPVEHGENPRLNKLNTGTDFGLGLPLPSKEGWGEGLQKSANRDRPQFAQGGWQRIHSEQSAQAMGLHENIQERLPAATVRQHPLKSNSIRPNPGHEADVSIESEHENPLTQQVTSALSINAMRKSGNSGEESHLNREQVEPPDTINVHEAPRSLLDRQFTQIGKAITGRHRSGIENAPIEPEETSAKTVPQAIENGGRRAITPVLITSLSLSPGSSALQPSPSPAGEGLDSEKSRADKQAQFKRLPDQDKEGPSFEDIPIAVRQPAPSLKPKLPTGEVLGGYLGENEKTPIPQTIRVTIGRIEVKAVMPPQPPIAKRNEPPKPRLSLEDYLQQQRKGQ